MAVVDLARRRAELERMSTLQPSPPRAGQPVDMRHARRFAELVERRRTFEDPRWAERHSPEPRS